MIEIHNSNEEIKGKLRRIDDVWAEFDYCEEWRDFIYYLPIQDNDKMEKQDENYVYKRFVEYLKNEVKKLK